MVVYLQLISGDKGVMRAGGAWLTSLPHGQSAQNALIRMMKYDIMTSMKKLMFSFE